MFVVEYLKKIKKDQLVEQGIREGIRSQISLVLQENLINKESGTIKLAEDIDKTISFLEYAEIEGKEQEMSSHIEVLDSEIRSLINALEKEVT